MRATLLTLLAVVVAFATPLTPQAEASSNPGVTFSPGLLEVEEGGTNQYTVVLDSEPASNATVAVDSYYLGGRNGVTYNPSSLVFTTHNWDTPQSITVTALQDDDDRTFLFGTNHTVTVDDRTFRGGASITLRVIDDDQEEVKLSTTALTLFEGESSDYTVWLNRQPQNNVTVDPRAVGSNFVFEPSELTFTPHNWATPQTFTITAEYDDDWVNDTATISHSGGRDYGHKRRTEMTVTVNDILEPGVRVYPRTLALDAGGTASYGISMWSTRCTDDTVVTVRIRSNNPSVSVNKSQVTFTRASCYDEMPVIVSAASGAGNITATLTHTVTGHSNVTTAPPLPVTVTGNGTTTPVTTTTTTPVTTTTTTPVTTTTPDLEMGTVVVSDENLSSGSHFTLSTSVTNEGDGDSEATTIRFYRSTDSTITNSDTQQSSSPVIPLAAQGQKVTAISVSLTAPSEEDTYYYGACVDSVTGETDTADNCSASVTVTVTATVNRPATGAPTISGTAQVGQTLTASTSAITDTDGLTNVSYSYQWLADDTEIDGATNSTYTPQTTDIGKVIKVRVTFTDDGDNDESLTSAGTVTVTVTATVNRPATGAPTISGTAQVGQTLTASTSAITDPDGLTNVSYSYQWLADDTEIDGATNSTYTPQTTDIGKVIKVRVTFTDDGDNDESLTSAGTVTVTVTATVNRPATGAPTISGTAQVGQTLTASTSAITDPDGLTNVSYSYQWLADDTEIDRATNSTYTPQTTDIGKVIKVRVTFTDDGDNDESLTSAGTVTVTVTATVNRPATGAPTISGTAQVGQTLTASTSAITDPDGLTNVSYSYQWLADDTEIDRATNSTYTPQTTDIGKVIKVRVTFTDDGDNDESLTSAGTVTVTVTATVNRPATGAPTISGTAQVGQTLTASTSTITDPDGLTNVSYSYQWLADDTEIDRATNSTYTPQTTDIGKVIKVRVTFTDDGDNDEQLTSAAYPGSGTIIAATTKRPVRPVAPTKVTTDPAKDPDNDADADSDSDTEPDTDTDTGDGDESQGGENRIDCDDLETQTPFVDVLESSPAAQAIACIYALGITTGTTPTTYSPGANVNRAQMASFLARLYKATTGTEAPIADTPFTDVATTSPTYNDIGRIYGLSITTGTSPTTYSPGANVTRAQMASFLARLYKATTETDAPIADTPFTDVATTSSAYNDIGRIYGLGITTGTTPTTYSPATNVTRAQMASFLAGLYKATTETDAPITETPFTDVATTSSAYNDIGRIYGLGITTGTTPTSYSPGANVTRAQMASFLARLYKATTETQKPLKPTNRSGPLVPWTH